MIAVLVAFVLYRYAVFRVRGPVLSDLWRYSGLVNLDNTPGLTPIGGGASTVIYRVGDCRS